eukprot:5874673-Amphidinium_carterae.1
MSGSKKQCARRCWLSGGMREVTLTLMWEDTNYWQEAGAILKQKWVDRVRLMLVGPELDQHKLAGRKHAEDLHGT